MKNPARQEVKQHGQQHAVTAECITVNRTVSSVGVEAKIFTIIFLVLGVNSFK